MMYGYRGEKEDGIDPIWINQLMYSPRVITPFPSLSSSARAADIDLSRLNPFLVKSLYNAGNSWLSMTPDLLLSKYWKYLVTDIINSLPSSFILNFSNRSYDMKNDKISWNTLMIYYGFTSAFHQSTNSW